IGEGGASRGDGGNTTFGRSIVVAASGKSGDNDNAGGASGGLDSESVGKIRFSGGNGAAGGNTGEWLGTDYSEPGGGAAGSTGNGNNAAGQYGGAATAENGGAGGNSITNQGNGNAGSIYGGGGSGALRSWPWNGNRIGGAGANGLIRISYVPAYRAGIISMDTGDDIWEAGETRDISVTVMNTGQATWTNSEPDVNIGVKWDAESDYMVSVNADNLVPGET